MIGRTKLEQLTGCSVNLNHFIERGVEMRARTSLEWAFREPRRESDGAYPSDGMTSPPDR